MKKESIKLTGTTLPVIALYLAENASDMIFDQLAAKVSQSAQFFNRSPIVIDLAHLPASAIGFSIPRLVEHCRSLSLQPIAFRNVHQSLRAQAMELPILSDTNKGGAAGPQTTIDPQAFEAMPGANISSEDISGEDINTESSSTSTQPRGSKLITKPIRSGQQVYAEGSDLIIMAQVSEGSEVIADGHIHVYGALRGRALAGVKGDTQARIFCQQMNAELVAIAGNFLLSDSIDDDLVNQAAQVSLDGERLVINPLK